MNNLDFYRNRVLSKGSSNKEIIINEKSNSFKNYLETAPNSYFVQIGNDSHDALIQDIRLNQELLDDKYLVVASDTNVAVGDYVIWEDKKFIIKTREIETIKSKQSFKMTHCNHIAKWINKDGKLISRDVVLTAKTLYTTGMRSESSIEYPDAIVSIMFPRDNDTKGLNRGDSFVFNKSKYKITFYNEDETEGIILVICDETAYNSATDDSVNQIADRYVNGIDRLANTNMETGIITSPEPNNPLVEYEIMGADTIIWDDTEQYNVRKTDETELSDLEFVFSIDNKTIATLNAVNDISCSIYAIMRKRGLVTLTATETISGIVIEKIINIKGFF